MKVDRGQPRTRNSEGEKRKIGDWLAAYDRRCGEAPEREDAGPDHPPPWSRLRKELFILVAIAERGQVVA
jgi:hypothetical protein